MNQNIYTNRPENSTISYSTNLTYMKYFLSYKPHCLMKNIYIAKSSINLFSQITSFINVLPKYKQHKVTLQNLKLLLILLKFIEFTNFTISR